MAETKSLGAWIDEVKKSAEYKAISLAFDGASFLSKAYDKLKSLFFPDPSTAELIKQAVEQIIRAFREAQAQDLAADVRGFSDTYASWLSGKNPDLLSLLISGLNGCLAKMEVRIGGASDARSAALVAEAYNLGTALLATAKLQDAQVGQLYRSEKPDWPAVLEQNRRLFERAVEHNRILLGPPVFPSEPGLALWRYSQGKLYVGASDEAARLRVTETVWAANERLRELLSPDYPAGWFTVRSASSAVYLGADPTMGAVRGVGEQQYDLNALWRLDHVTHETARVVNRSGLCLYVNPAGGSLIEPSSRVRLLPADAGGCEFDYHVLAAQEGRLAHYRRGWRDGQWRLAGTVAVTPASAPAAFLNVASASAFNHEAFARVGDQVQHVWRSAADRGWRLGQTFGTRVRSAPAAFQNQAPAAEFNYEVFVVEDGAVAHYWRSWQDGRWFRAGTIGANVTFGPAAFQNVTWNSMYNYELFVVEGGAVQHYWRGWTDGAWHKGARFGADVQSAPAAFQNRANGNAEVFVIENGSVQHYWRAYGESQWRKGTAFGRDIRSAPAVFQNRAASALHNYEVFAVEGGAVQHYWRDWRDGMWRTGVRFGERPSLGIAAMQTIDFRDGQLWDWVDVTGQRAAPSIAVEVKPLGHLLLRSGEIWTKRRSRIGDPQDTADALVFKGFKPVPAVERCSLEPLTAPGRFVRHQDFRAKVTAVASDLDRQDATFRLMPGLASGTAVSFEAVNFPGYFLRHRNFELVLAARGSDAALRPDATFRRRPGLADPALASFESENYPGRFLRHRNGLLYLESGEDSAFARDATFRVQPPRWTAP